jgi:GGDEF domain-containing protein
MNQYIVSLSVLALSLSVILFVKVRWLSYCEFGLSKAALRWQLTIWSLLRIPCAVIAVDFRKIHDINGLFGYGIGSELMKTLAQVRTHDKDGHKRRHDIIGQWGGDEHILALRDPRAWGLVLDRFRANMRAATEAMTAAERQVLFERTGGLVDGLHAAISVVPYTRDAYGAAVRAIEATGPMKDGPQTGSRSTSGAVGTVMQVLT